MRRIGVLHQNLTIGRRWVKNWRINIVLNVAEHQNVVAAIGTRLDSNVEIFFHFSRKLTGAGVAIFAMESQGMTR